MGMLVAFFFLKQQIPLYIFFEDIPSLGHFPPLGFPYNHAAMSPLMFSEAASKRSLVFKA